MELRRVGMTLAAALLVALAGCSKEVGTNAEAKPSVGAKIDRAIDRTQQKLSDAGERARQDIEQATQKTQETLSKAGEKISAAASKENAPGSPPYAPRQPVADSGAPIPGAPSGGDGTTTTATTTTLSTGPTTSVKVTPLPNTPR